MNINPTDHVLHLSFDDIAYGRADIFCGMFNKRQVANKTYKPIDYSTVKLPFKDKTFDYVHCVNVLTHSHQPEAMLEEIKRIGKKAHIEEHSEFAEIIFGWDNTRWVVSVEDMQFVIKSKNDLRFKRFGPYFHGLYANDPVFYDYCSQNPGLLKTAVDWFEEDDIVEEIEEEVEEFVVPDLDKKDDEQEKLFEDVDENKLEDKEDTPELNVTMAETRKVIKKIKRVKSIFRPCQTEYFDDTHINLGLISEKIDVRNLKNKNLS